MHSTNKRRAFTLTELLVVVIVLGILAGVAVPKFKRVIETRKTEEAKNRLASIRSEQEARCIAGKNYFGDITKLEVLAKLPASKNYDYSLQSTGASASAIGSDYTLKMLSYKSGDICCDGSGCERLNDRYPDCGTLQVAEDECAASDEEVVETKTEHTCTPSSWMENVKIGSGDALGTCSVSHRIVCDDDNNASEQLGTPSCTCENANYFYSADDEACVQEEDTCEEKITHIEALSRVGSDTCDGNTNSQYTCDGVFKGTCTDVYRASFSGTSNFVKDTSWWLPSDSFQQGILLAFACTSDSDCNYIGSGMICYRGQCRSKVDQVTNNTINDPIGPVHPTGGGGGLLPDDEWRPTPGPDPEVGKEITSVGFRLSYSRKVTCCGRGGTPFTPPTATCTPGTTATGNACGNCGEQYRTVECSADGRAVETLECRNEGVCSPGDVDSKTCSGSTTTIHRSCTSACSWGSWSSCPSTGTGGGSSGGGAGGGSGGCATSHSMVGGTCYAHRCCYGVCNHYPVSASSCDGKNAQMNLTADPNASFSDTQLAADVAKMWAM